MSFLKLYLDDCLKDGTDLILYDPYFQSLIVFKPSHYVVQSATSKISLRVGVTPNKDRRNPINNLIKTIRATETWDQTWVDLHEGWFYVTEETFEDLPEWAQQVLI
jgi:hypothetical protein